MRWVKSALAAGFVLAAPNMALAQSSEPVPAVVEAAVVVAPVEAPATVTIPAGTNIVVEFVEGQSSRTTQTGQLVALRLADPIVINGQTIVAAGAAGGGEVIDAARSGMGGRQGKLIISGRYVEIGGQQARIRGLRVFAAGEDNSREAVNTMILVPYVGFMGGFIQGGETEIPAGSRAQARLAADVVVPLSALPAAAPAAEVHTAAEAPPAAAEQPEQQQPSGVEDTQ
jgi:hypothetical protein